MCVVVMEWWCVLVGGLRLLLHKAKTASAKWRDGADEVSEFKK